MGRDIIIGHSSSHRLLSVAMRDWEKDKWYPAPDSMEELEAADNQSVLLFAVQVEQLEMDLKESMDALAQWMKVHDARIDELEEEIERLDKEFDMKYDDQVRAYSGGDKQSQQIQALYTIANELAKINKFLDDIGIDEEKFDKLFRHWIGG